MCTALLYLWARGSGKHQWPKVLYMFLRTSATWEYLGSKVICILELYIYLEKYIEHVSVITSRWDDGRFLFLTFAFLYCLKDIEAQIILKIRKVKIIFFKKPFVFFFLWTFKTFKACVLALICSSCWGQQKHGTGDFEKNQDNFFCLNSIGLSFL